MTIRPIRTLTDIRANTTRTDTDKGPVFITHMGPDANCVAAIGQIKNPDRPGNLQDQVYRNDDWAGTRSYDDAVYLYRNGWPEGRAIVEKITSRIKSVLPKARKVVYKQRATVAPHGGLRINFHDIMTGGPSPFIGRFKTHETVQGGQKIVKMIVSNWICQGTPTSVIQGRGATLLALIHTLETFGIVVDVTVSCATGNDGYRAAMNWHVKPAGRPLNMDSLAFAFVNNAACRRVGFGMLALLPGKDTAQAFAYYGNASYSRGIVRDFPELAKQYDIVADMDSQCVFDGKTWQMADNWASPEAQIAYVKSQLAKFGVEFI